jgi:hypothetical protein
VIALNRFHKNIFMELTRLKNDFTYGDTDTVASQLSYNLPADCKLKNIIKVEVSEVATADITDITEWTEYERAGINDDKTTGYWYYSIAAGAISLRTENIPIATAGLTLRIWYYPSPDELASDAAGLAATPDLDEDYHDALIYALANYLASVGDNPDTQVADYWQAKYDEFMKKVKDSLTDDYISRPTQSTRCREIW